MQNFKRRFAFIYFLGGEMLQVVFKLVESPHLYAMCDIAEKIDARWKHLK